MKSNRNNCALLLEGGGFRGMYTSGVLDVLLKNGIRIPYLVGVSAGAAYGISYISGQHGRNLTVNQKYRNDPRYQSWWHWLRAGSIFNWPFVYGEVPKNLVPFNFDAFYASGAVLKIGVTNCITGEPEFMDGHKGKPEDLMLALTASSSIPFISKIVNIGNIPYLDGGISDSIPLDFTLKQGFDKILVVLTQNGNYRKKPASLAFIWKLLYPRHPKMVNALLNRPNVYNKTLDDLEKLESEGKIFILRPKKEISISRLERSMEKLDALYFQAIEETEEQIETLKAWLSN